MRLRIAHVLLSLHIGGGERVALQLATHHARAGHEVVVVSFEEPTEGPLAADFEASRVKILRVRKGAGFDFTLPKRLRDVFVERRFDVVHTHNPLPLIYAAIPARTSGATVVHTKHGPHPDRPLRLWLRRAGAFATHAFVAVSEDSAEFARQVREVSPGKLTIIENGVDTDAHRPDPEARSAVRAELGIPSGAWVVGTVGRVAPVKNHTLLVRALAPALSPDRHLVIAGGGPDEPALRALVDELGVAANTHLLGPRSDVPRVLCALDAFALSSDTEGLPLVLPEAMATELPVVATAVGGVPKVVVEGESGHLVPPRDERALREALLGLQADPDRSRRMGRRAREIAVARYSAARMADQYMQLYERRRS